MNINSIPSRATRPTPYTSTPSPEAARGARAIRKIDITIKLRFYGFARNNYPRVSILAELV